MTPEIIRDARRLAALRTAIRRAEALADEIERRISRRREDALRAIVDMVLSAPDEAARAEALAQAHAVLRRDR